MQDYKRFRRAPYAARNGDVTHSKPIWKLRFQIHGAVDFDTFDFWQDSVRKARITKKWYHPYGQDLPDQCMGVSEGEIAVIRHKTDVAESDPQLSAAIYEDDNQAAKFNDPYLRVVTCLNSLGISMPEADFKKLTLEEQKAKIKENFVPAGVIAYSKDVTRNPDHQQDVAHFIIDKGGQRAVVNNGGEPIQAGDPIMGDVCEFNQAERELIEGIDERKALFVYRPYKSRQAISYNNIKTKCKFLTSNGAVGIDNIQADLTKSSLKARFNSIQNNLGDDAELFSSFRTILPSASTPETHLSDTFMEDFLFIVYSCAAHLSSEDAISNDNSYEENMQNLLNFSEQTKRGLRKALFPDDTDLGRINSEHLRIRSKNAFQRHLQTFFIVREQIQRWIIGEALTDAMPGQQFDIKLSSVTI